MLLFQNLFRFLFLVPCVTSVAYWYFNFELDLICRNGYTKALVPNFCYKVRFFDNGNFFDGTISEMPKQVCTGSKTRAVFNMTGYIFLWKWKAFVKSEIHHNCTSNGGFITRVRERAMFSDESKTIHVPLELDLFDKGPE